MKVLILKTRLNKTNGQLNISLPKKKLPKEMQDFPERIKNVQMKLEGWDLW